MATLPLKADLSSDQGLTQAIERRLRERIIAGELPSGAPLRQEHLADSFGASAIPVREALRRLERTGLVAFRPRHGAVVTAVSAANATEVSEMRAALEPLALATAAPHWGPTHFARARLAILAADKSDDAMTWLNANRAFHGALYEACARPRLLAAIDDLWLNGDRHLVLAWRRLAYQSRSQDEHRAILSKCEAGDVAKAAELLKAHILEAGVALAGLLEAPATTRSAGGSSDR